MKKSFSGKYFFFFFFNLAYLARQATLLQTKLSKETDKRIRLMNETIIGIRVIKMYGLEHVFENVIKEVRRFVQILSHELQTSNNF